MQIKVWKPDTGPNYLVKLLIDLCSTVHSKHKNDHIQFLHKLGKPVWPFLG